MINLKNTELQQRLIFFLSIIIRKYLCEDIFKYSSFKTNLCLLDCCTSSSNRDNDVFICGIRTQARMDKEQVKIQIVQQISMK
jgi:hypothetical protein